jgi:hypothetical protein
MRGGSAGVAAWSVAACAGAALAAGCGTAPVAEPAHSAPTPARTVNPGQSGIATDGPLGVRAYPGCRGATPAGRMIVITLAGNGKRYCVRVGDKLRVSLRPSGASQWQQPLVSGAGAVVTAPGAASTPAGGTQGSFAAARPGQATMTSVLPPCQYTVPARKNAFEPADPLPTTNLPRVCPPDHRFSALIIVLR